MSTKGIVIVPSTVEPGGRWLDSTGAASLLPVGNRPMICHALDALDNADVEEIAVLVPAPLRDEISRHVERDRCPHAKLRYLDWGPSSGAWTWISRLAAFARDAPAILHSSDGVLDEPLRPLADLLRSDGADVLLLATEEPHAAPALGLRTQRALGVAALPPGSATLGLAGVCFVAPGVLDRLVGTPMPPVACGLAALAESLSAAQRTGTQARIVHGWHGFAGDPADLLDINRTVLDHLELPEHTQPRDGNRLEGHVQIDPSASVRASVICGPAVIGASATIKDSYIGPHTSIGERVQLEGAEIERSIVFAGASIRHVGDRLVASVIGQDTKIFRDFSVPRAMRVYVGDGDEVALC